MKNKLSIIIPIYNEKSFLERLFKDIFQVFKDSYVEYIIINDGSFDGGELWLEKHLRPISDKKIKNLVVNDNNTFQLQATESKDDKYYSKIILINHAKNKGKGASVISGLKKSTGKYLTILDADLEYDPRDSLIMYNLMNENNMGEVIFGSRFTSGLPHRHQYVLNSLVNHLNTFLFNIFFNSAINDVHCGLKIFTRNVYENINLTSKDFSIDLDLGTQISKAGFNISEVGVRYYSRTYNQGKKITFFDGLITYWYLCKFRFFNNHLKRNLIIFLSVITGCLAGAHFGDGIGKIGAVIIGGLFGSVYGSRYSLTSLFCLIIGLLIGSQFSKGNGKIFTVIVGGLIGILTLNKINQYFDNKNKKLAQ